MECLDNSNNNNSHLANNSGQCTQTVVRTDVTVTRVISCRVDIHYLLFFIYDSFLLGIPLPRHARLR